VVALHKKSRSINQKCQSTNQRLGQPSPLTRSITRSNERRIMYAKNDTIQNCFWQPIIKQLPNKWIFLVCTWRHRRHVGVPLTKYFSLAYIVRYSNMAAISLSFYSLRNEWKPKIHILVKFINSKCSYLINIKREIKKRFTDD
jgi:hypothetical protein